MSATSRSLITSRQSPTIGTSALPVLADLGRVDVGVDHLRARRERVEVAGHPVVEAGAEADDQVAALQPGDRGDGAVHAGHAEVLRVAVGEGAAGHQRGDHRHAGQLGQLPQLREAPARIVPPPT